MLNFITGGVCAAQGFRAGGIHVGVKTHAAWKKDVALIVSDEDCACAAVYTKNAVKAAHIHVDKRHLADGKARAAVINSGNANACAPMGEENAERVCAAAGKALGCRPEDVVVAATGVIGQTLNVAVIEQGMPELCAAAAHTAAGSDAAAHAIMTTDTVKKELAVETVIGGKTVRMGGIAKGYVADRLCDLLRDETSATGAVLSLGGNIALFGEKPSGEPWETGVRDPNDPGGDTVVGTARVQGGSLVTSGLYERVFEQDGVTYWHILDPRTGEPVQTDVASVTVLSPSSTAADALSTTLFVAGSRHGAEIADALEDTAAYFILQDGRTVESTRWQELTNFSSQMGR